MGPLDLITGPVRLAAAVAGGALGVAVDVLKGARGLLEGEAGEEARPSPTPESAQNGTAAGPVPPPPMRTAPPPSPTPEPSTEEEHADEGTVLVAEVAETGAQDGAGPELEVEEPWDGYDRMTVEQIHDRLTEATREAVAAVQLYEAVTKSRDSVLEAAESRLRDLTSPPA
jgi:hypothetical protein